MTGVQNKDEPVTVRKTTDGIYCQWQMSKLHMDYSHPSPWTNSLPIPKDSSDEMVVILMNDFLTVFSGNVPTSGRSA